MNKKADFAWTLTKILLILIVVIVILIGGGRLIFEAGKNALNIFGLINITEIDYSNSNQNAKLNFNNFINNVKSCKLSSDNNCLCFTSFEDFDKTHEIEINNKEIRLINTKDDNSITIDKKEIQDFNCYYDKDSLKIENPLIIIFDEESPRIKKESLNIDFLSKDIKFDRNPAIYKSNKICLIAKNFELIKLNKCKT